LLYADLNLSVAKVLPRRLLTTHRHVIALRTLNAFSKMAVVSQQIFVEKRVSLGSARTYPRKGNLF
jgi:hypothetical protein